MILPALLAVYIGALAGRAEDVRQRWRPLDPPPPVALLKVASLGYLRQFWAEALFARAAVQYGGEPSSHPVDVELNAYLRYFRTMSELHPRLLDAYYRCEAVLGWESPRYVRWLNDILRWGEKNLPREVVLPFFEGFNLFKRLHEVSAAAEAFRRAAAIPGAPPWIGHLAGVLMARGGDIRGGLMMLRAMLAAAGSEKEKQRVRKEIGIYEQALRVQLAIEAYRRRFHVWPLSLNELVPDFMPRLPRLEENYVLRYHPPILSLEHENGK